jgi:FtsP/CotA-like multicopper oxidase with cupredoxin domain
MMGAVTEPGHLRHGDPLPDADIPPATETPGGQLLAYREENGVKVFELTSRLVKWHILPDVQVTAMTYNGTVPGPEIRVTQGDRVKVLLKNELPYPTTIHWHGILVPNNMDGVPDMTQAPVPPGGSFTYEFTAEPAGTYWYHSHVQTDAQVLTGLYAPFIIEPKEPTDPRPDVDVTLMLSEWRVIGGQTFPAMPMSGMDPNYFTINGKAFPTVEPLKVKLGQRVRLRFVAAGQFVHPMHLHGPHFKIVATDGYPVPQAAQLTKDTVSVAPGERYDVEFVADMPGKWMLHCHIPHHTTNDGEEPGGLMMVIEVE